MFIKLSDSNKFSNSEKRMKIIPESKKAVM